MAVGRRHVNLAFRPLTDEDLPMMCEWLNRPHLQRWWREQDTSLETIRSRYLPRIREEDCAHPYIAMLQLFPIGYIQYYLANAGDPDWWPDAPGPGVLGIDQFLADEHRLGQGLGTAMVRAFASMLFDDPSATEIRVDPRPENLRAIRCYEKVGFERRGRITTPDGPALMMVLSRPARGLSRPRRASE